MRQWIKNGTVFLLSSFVTISICLFFFSVGYYTGHKQVNPYDNTKIGEVSFCDLTEADRLVVCPAVRKSQKLQTGGSLVIYLCGENSTGYIEVKNLTEESKTIVDENLLNFRNNGLQINKICDTKVGKIYKVAKTMEATKTGGMPLSLYLCLIQRSISKVV